ncbi:MAG: polysulfide reductase NrfD [Firmicutes bacterium]|nr:polysulfide reductase NrfD [Bacillota bacterium]
METKQEYWGSLAAGYFFLAALGAMMFVIAAVLDLAGVALAGQINGWVSLVALIVTGIGALLLTVELGDKTKFYLVMTKPSSIMSLGAMMMSAFMVIALVYTTTFFSFVPWYPAYGLREVLAVLGIIAAVGLVAYPGLELGEARGRAFWNGSGLVPLFLVNGASSGIAGVILMSVILGEAQSPAILKLNGGIWFGFIVAQVILLTGYLLGIKNTGVEEARRAVAGILQGDLRVKFWWGVVVAGALMPLIMYLFGNSPALLAAKAILVLIGCACFRCVFLQAAVRRSLPGEESEWMSAQEEAKLGLQLEKRWKEKEAWLYGGK